MMPEDTENSNAAETIPNLQTPLIFIGVALFLLAASQTFQLVRDRQSLRSLIADQEGPIETAQKVRKQLDAIATSTAQLAAQGNSNARLIVDQLKNQGITVNLPTESRK